MTSNHFVGGDSNKQNTRVRLKCLASISDFYWKTAEITLLQERPKFASVMKNKGGDSSSGGAGLEVGAVQQQKQDGAADDADGLGELSKAEN